MYITYVYIIYIIYLTNDLLIYFRIIQCISIYRYIFPEKLIGQRPLQRNFVLVAYIYYCRP